MRKLFSIAWNDIKIELSSRWTLLFYAALPIIFTAIIGAALGGSQQGSSKISLPYFDADRSVYSQQFREAVERDGLLNLLDFDTEEEAHTFFIDKHYTALLIVPEGFGDAIADGQTASVRMIEQPSETLLSIDQSVQSAARQLGYAYSITSVAAEKADELRRFSGEKERRQFMASVYADAEKALAAPAVSMEAVTGSRNQLGANGFSQSSPGQLVTWVMITLLSGSEVFVNERLGGTLRRLMITPNRKGVIIGGKILGRFILGMLQMILLVGFGVLVLKVNWGGNPLALAVMLVTFGLAGTALGVMLGAFARTRSQSNSLAVMFSMLLSALGGAWWPLEITPSIYQTTVKVLPTTWAMTGLTDVIVRGMGLVEILPSAGILLGFALLFFVIGIWKLKYE